MDPWQAHDPHDPAVPSLWRAVRPAARPVISAVAVAIVREDPAIPPLGPGGFAESLLTRLRAQLAAAPTGTDRALLEQAVAVLTVDPSLALDLCTRLRARGAPEGPGTPATAAGTR